MYKIGDIINFKSTIHEEYENIYKYFSKLFSNPIVLLMQNGTFYEMYSFDEEKVPLNKISQLMGINMTKKKNPRMAGVHINTAHFYIDKMNSLGWTIIRIDQVGKDSDDNFLRKIVDILSPAMNVENAIGIKPNNLVGIQFELLKSKNSNSLCIACIAVDLSIGNLNWVESHTEKTDTLSGLDEICCFLQKYPAKEFFIVSNDFNLEFNNMTINDLIKYIGLDTNTPFEKINKNMVNTEILDKTFNIASNIDTLEALGMSCYTFATSCLYHLILYITKHQPNLLNNIELPKQYISNNFLHLGNHALEQLDIYKNSNSLFNIIDKTNTTLGSRFLLSQLTSPIISSVELNNRYDLIQNIIKNKYTNSIDSKMENIYDLDRLIRKLTMLTITPNDIYQIYLSLSQIVLVSDLVGELFNIDKKQRNELQECIEYINNKFDVNIIEGINFRNYTETNKSFYLTGQNEEIDILVSNISKNDTFIIDLVLELDKYITEKPMKRKIKKDVESDCDEQESQNKIECEQDSPEAEDIIIGKGFIKIKFNKKSGHYLQMTSKRYDNLMKVLPNIIKISGSTLKKDDLKSNKLPKGTNVNITCDKINDLSKSMETDKQKLAQLLIETFKNDMKIFSKKYYNILLYWASKIAFIDFINCGAKVAIKNHYTKPIIINNEKSFIKAKKLRHPIVESLDKSTEYIPHDIELGEKGIILYGINSSGKSTLMKSIGINIVMSQIGFWVASEKFEYQPYKSIFTRINGNDNIFKGLSSFMVEMMELIAILKRNSSNTLVIADELCRGTEEKSANIIVAYMMDILTKSGTSFITATHLHKLTLLPTIQNLVDENKLLVKHLKITLDEENDCLIYSRELLDGQGESFYGLQIAKYLMKDKTFSEMTSKILNEYDMINNEVSYEVKTSKYNPKVIINKCEICDCNENIETHHIEWQKDWKDDQLDKKLHLKMNAKSNLVPLCKECHDKVDSNEIIVKGWIETSNGIKLEHYNSSKFNSKIKGIETKKAEEIIKFIKTSGIQDTKIIKIKLLEKFEEKLTLATIKKFI